MISPTLQRLAARFTLRDLLVAIGILGVGLAIAAHYQRQPERFPEIVSPERVPQGVVEGSLTSAGLLLFYAMRLRFPRWRRTIRTALIVAGLICLWFAAVDRAHHVAWCPRCGNHVTSISFRIYRIPICAWHFDNPNHYPSVIAADLGVPCPHKYEQELWVRWWGFAVRYPAVGGTLYLAEEPYQELRPYVLEMAAEDPNLGEEFNRRAIEEPDPKYFNGFFAEIRRRRAVAESQQPTD